jgi:hypothetical protein
MNDTSHRRQAGQSNRDELVDRGPVRHITAAHNDLSACAIEAINLYFRLST